MNKPKKMTTVSINLNPTCKCDNCLRVFTFADAKIRKSCPHCGLPIIKGSGHRDAGALILGE